MVEIGIQIENYSKIIDIKDYINNNNVVIIFEKDMGDGLWIQFYGNVKDMILI